MNDIFILVPIRRFLKILNTLAGNEPSIGMGPKPQTCHTLKKPHLICLPWVSMSLLQKHHKTTLYPECSWLMHGHILNGDAKIEFSTVGQVHQKEKN